MFCHLPAWPHSPGLESMIKNSFFIFQSTAVEVLTTTGNTWISFQAFAALFNCLPHCGAVCTWKVFQLGRAAVKELRTHFCHIPRMMAGRQAIYQTFDVRIKHLFQNRRQFLNGWALPGLLHSCLKIAWFFPFLTHTLLNFKRRKNLVHHHLPSQMLL